LNKKDNDKFYLVQGDYKLEISLNGNNASTKFKVKEGRKRPGR
jgi:hypothetical protein